MCIFKIYIHQKLGLLLCEYHDEQDSWTPRIHSWAETKWLLSEDTTINSIAQYQQTWRNDPDQT